MFMYLIVCVALGLVLSDGVEERIKGPGVEKTSPGEFPYLVKIKDKKTDTLIGAGTLLKSKVVLGIGYNYRDRK